MKSAADQKKFFRDMLASGATHAQILEHLDSLVDVSYIALGLARRCDQALKLLIGATQEEEQATQQDVQDARVTVTQSPPVVLPAPQTAAPALPAAFDEMPFEPPKPRRQPKTVAEAVAAMPPTPDADPNKPEPESFSVDYEYTAPVPLTEDQKVVVGAKKITRTVAPL